MNAGRLVFECGACLKVNDVTKCDFEKGSRLMVYSTIHGTIGRPKDEDGCGVNCRFACPVKVKDSGRKVQVGYNNSGRRGHVVTCVVQSIEKDTP